MASVLWLIATLLFCNAHQTLRIHSDGEDYPDPHLEIEVEDPEGDADMSTPYSVLQEAVLKSWEKMISIKVGDKVVRGPDWKWGNADGGEGHKGVVIAEEKQGWWKVQWKNGNSNNYRYNSKAHDVIVLRDVYNGLHGQHLPRVHWAQAGFPLPEHIATLDRPVVFEGYHPANWKASNWTLSSIISHLPKNLTGAKQAKRRVGKETPFFYFHHAPMDTEPLVEGYRQRAYQRVDLPRDHFFQELELENSEFIRSYATSIDTLSPECIKDALPLTPFMVLPPDYTPSDEARHRRTLLWISPKNSTTPVHFDLFHNFFIQIQGRKKIVVFPPSQWEQLYLYPILHPGGRSAQVDISDPSQYASNRKLFPNFKRSSLIAFETTVGPGDVIYIPPLWFHHVVTLETSLSLSVWSEFPITLLIEQFTKDVALPILTKWSTEERASALRVLFGSLLSSLEITMNLGQFIEWALLDSRYRHVGDYNSHQGQMLSPYCWVKELEDSVVLQSESLLLGYVEKLSTLFKELEALGGLERRDVEIANYFELAANTVVGTQNVKQLFYDFCYC